MVWVFHLSKKEQYENLFFNEKCIENEIHVYLIKNLIFFHKWDIKENKFWFISIFSG